MFPRTTEKPEELYVLFHSYLKKKKRKRNRNAVRNFSLPVFRVGFVFDFFFFFNLQIFTEYHNISYSNESILLILRFFQNHTQWKKCDDLWSLRESLRSLAWMIALQLDNGSVAIVSGEELPLDLTSDRSLIVKKRMTMRKGRHVRLLRHWTFLSWLLYKEKKRREKKEDKKNRNSFYKAKFFFSFVLWRYRKQFCNFFNAKYWYIQDWKRFKSSQSSMCLVFAVVNHSHVSYSVDDLLTRTE